MNQVIVTGSRTWPSRSIVCKVLDELYPALVIHGNARGVDQFAHDWAIARERDFHGFTAKWRESAPIAGTQYNPAAGHIRNGRMLDSYPNTLVLAFPFGAAKGTRDCIRQAIERWHEVRVYNVKGEVIEHHQQDVFG